MPFDNWGPLDAATGPPKDSWPSHMEQGKPSKSPSPGWPKSSPEDRKTQQPNAWDQPRSSPEQEPPTSGWSPPPKRPTGNQGHSSAEAQQQTISGWDQPLKARVGEDNWQQPPSVKEPRANAWDQPQTSPRQQKPAGNNNWDQGCPSAKDHEDPVPNAWGQLPQENERHQDSAYDQDHRSPQPRNPRGNNTSPEDEEQTRWTSHSPSHRQGTQATAWKQSPQDRKDWDYQRSSPERRDGRPPRSTCDNRRQNRSAANQWREEGRWRGDATHYGHGDRKSRYSHVQDEIDEDEVACLEQNRSKWMPDQRRSPRSGRRALASRWQNHEKDYAERERRSRPRSRSPEVYYRESVQNAPVSPRKMGLNPHAQEYQGPVSTQYVVASTYAQVPNAAYGYPSTAGVYAQPVPYSPIVSTTQYPPPRQAPQQEVMPDDPKTKEKILKGNQVFQDMRATKKSTFQGSLSAFLSVKTTSSDSPKPNLSISTTSEQTKVVVMKVKAREESPLETIQEQSTPSPNQTQEDEEAEEETVTDEQPQDDIDSEKQELPETTSTDSTQVAQDNDQDEEDASSRASDEVEAQESREIEDDVPASVVTLPASSTCPDVILFRLHVDLGGPDGLKYLEFYESDRLRLEEVVKKFCLDHDLMKTPENSRQLEAAITKELQVLEEEERQTRVIQSIEIRRSPSRA